MMRSPNYVLLQKTHGKYTVNDVILYVRYLECVWEASASVSEKLTRDA